MVIFLKHFVNFNQIGMVQRFENIKLVKNLVIDFLSVFGFFEELDRALRSGDFVVAKENFSESALLKQRQERD